MYAARSRKRLIFCPNAAMAHKSTLLMYGDPEILYRAMQLPIYGYYVKDARDAARLTCQCICICNQIGWFCSLFYLNYLHSSLFFDSRTFFSLPVSLLDSILFISFFLISPIFFLLIPYFILLIPFFLFPSSYSSPSYSAPRKSHHRCIFHPNSLFHFEFSVK